MMRVCISIVIAMMVLSWSFVQKQDVSSIKLELLYEKPFADLYSTSEGFPPAEIKQILKRDDIPREDKEWLLNSLRLEIARREKILYTKDGDVVQLPLELKSIKTSDNLKYMIVYAAHISLGSMSEVDAGAIHDAWHEARKNAVQWSTKWMVADGIEKDIYRDSVDYWIKKHDSLTSLEKAVQFSRKEIKHILVMETETGKILWQKEGEVYTLTGKGDDIIPPAYISNDGKMAITVPGYHFFTSVIFSDENGIEMTKTNGLYGPQGCHDMSADGVIFCAITRLNVSDTSLMAVVAYDRQGNKFWQTELPGTWPRTEPCIAVSPNHKYLAVTLWGTNWQSEAYTYLLNDTGSVLNTFNFATYNPGFSFDDKFLVLRSDNDTTYYIQTANGEILWKKCFDGHVHKTPIITKYGRSIFFISREAGYPPDNLWDRNGNLVWQSNDQLRNAVGLSPSGYYFIPNTDPEIVIYQIITEVTYENR